MLVIACNSQSQKLLYKLFEEKVPLYSHINSLAPTLKAINFSIKPDKCDFHGNKKMNIICILCF